MFEQALFQLTQGGETMLSGTGYSDFRIFDVEGLSGLEFDFVTKQSPQSPNTVINNMKPLPREITLKIRTSRANRQYLNHFFNPFNRGKLTVTWNDAQRWIEYTSHPVLIVQETIYRDITAEVHLFCPEPYWRDMNDYGKNIAQAQALLAFPFVMLSRGVISDYRLFSSKVSIRNAGDVEVGVRVVFTALGNVENPQITLNGAGFIRVVTEMVKGDNITVNTGIDDIYVIKNGENALNYVDVNSTYFQIPTGENTMEYSADDGTANLQVTVYYTPLYINL